MPSQFGYVARAVASRELLNVNRRMFNIELGGFDTHARFYTFGQLLKIIDTALIESVAVMK